MLLLKSSIVQKAQFVKNINNSISDRHN